MIVRIWRARIDESRAEEYEDFARNRSVPTFRAHAGFIGCALLRDGADCTVVTLWDTQRDVERLETSDRYRETVAAIMATGFVRAAGEAHAASVRT